ncbi:MAG TPA: PIN domain-containing protein [Aquificaceae bacterium]|nr:PIN domain-containing protein [Aquificaceae bacterium]HIQ31690.1 PIN domain-containing protein [Aquifex aeolicus]
MKFLDTGVLLEFFSGDEEEIDRIDRMFRELERQKEKLFIPEEVIIELAYFLEYVQGWEREVVADVLRTVLMDSLFSVEDRDTVQSALSIYLSGRLSFLDSLKIAKARKRGIEEAISSNRRLKKAGLKLLRP